MHYRIIDLAFSSKSGRIDDEALQRLVHGHEVVETTEQFYLHEGTPHLLVALKYRLARAVTVDDLSLGSRSP